MRSELGIKEMRSLTSRQIRGLASADEIVITDRGEPIATLRPLHSPSPARRFLDDLRQERRGESGAMKELLADKQASIDAQHV